MPKKRAPKRARRLVSTPKTKPRRKSAPAKPRHTKLKELRAGQRRNYSRELTTRDKQKIKISRSDLAFKKASYATKSNKQKKFLESNVKATFRKYVQEQLKNRRGNKFILRLTTRHNYKGKRIKNAFSTRRVAIRNMKTFEKFWDYFTSEFDASMKNYLKRKDLASISFTGVSMEVVRK